MKRILMAAAMLCVASGAALADGDMSNAVGNTVRVTAGSDSFDATFAADGSYSDTRGVTGTWAVGDELCITVQAEEGPQSNCGPWNGDLQAGGSWTTTGWSSDGSEITVEIIAGG